MNKKDGTQYESIDEWREKGRSLFGEDYEQWKFVCPACKRVSTVSEYREHVKYTFTLNAAAQNCLGRYTGGRKGLHKCDWAAYGLFHGPSFVKDGDKNVAIFMFDGE